MTSTGTISSGRSASTPARRSHRTGSATTATVAVERPTQRWRDRRQRWRIPADGSFDPARYSVTAMANRPAAEFVLRHHYAATWPATKYRYGLYDQTVAATPVLVGVLTLGVPMSNRVLTNVFPDLHPNIESLELSRLVLLDSVPSNGESWFCARVFRLAAAHQVRGIVAFADPVPRWRHGHHGHDLIKPGHCGIVYQALNFAYLGRGTARTQIVLPDATVLSARAIAKITGAERGHQGVIERLVTLGATAPPAHTDLAAWLRTALHTVHAVRQPHPGNHRYAIRIGRTRADRSQTRIGLAAGDYPKPELTLPIDGLQPG